MWDLPWPGFEPVSLILQGIFLTWATKDALLLPSWFQWNPCSLWFSCSCFPACVGSRCPWDDCLKVCLVPHQSFYTVGEYWPDCGGQGPMTSWGGVIWGCTGHVSPGIYLLEACMCQAGGGSQAWSRAAQLCHPVLCTFGVHPTHAGPSLRPLPSFPCLASAHTLLCPEV